jgi:hypothetical protein
MREEARLTVLKAFWRRGSTERQRGKTVSSYSVSRSRHLAPWLAPLATHKGSRSSCSCHST